MMMSQRAMLVALLCAAWILPGLIGRDPWKPDEAHTFGVVYELLRGGSWVVPTLAGEPFVEKPPLTTWMKSGPSEYGFYSNVNPDVDHPRWSQKFERRIGEFRKRRTLMFNGYGDQVASLYSGMDLKKYF